MVWTRNKDKITRTVGNEGFPFNGKVLGRFSTQWKLFRLFFHSMEKFAPFFPLNGSFFDRFSTQWKLSVRADSGVAELRPPPFLH